MERRGRTVAAFTAGVPLSTSISRRPFPASATLPLRPPRRGLAQTVRATLGAPLGFSSNNSYHQMMAATMLQSLLTRRSVWTIAYYLAEMNDSGTSNWMLGFEDFQRRDQSNTFDDDGTFLHNMLRSKPVTATMTVGHPRSRLKREFRFDINPYRVANRILAARVQLAEEWCRDLRCIALENKEIVRMALERMFHADEKSLDRVRANVFDYDNLEGDQTPLRYKNYCKLKLFITLHAISRLEITLRDTSNHDYMFFRAYCRSALPMASDQSFILGLMALPPAKKVNPEYEIDPKRLAHKLMGVRAQVAAECIAVMSGVEEAQKRDQRKRLEASMLLAAIGEDLQTDCGPAEEQSQTLHQDPTASPIDSAS
jgi:hypothetical protein